MPGLDKLLMGILKYRTTLKPRMVQQFYEVKNDPHPKALMFCCMDSRLIITRLVQQDVGDMFIVRNAGNLIPNEDCMSFDAVTTEPGALELACIVNKIRHVIVCGHSDCKAIQLLYSLRHDIKNHQGSPLEVWMKRHGARSVAKFNTLESVGGVGPIAFEAETPDKAFSAYIDPERILEPADRLSQVNTLQQLQNIASYSFLESKLRSGQVKLNALWFDIYDGDFQMFSREKQRFVEVTEESYEHLAVDGDSYVDPKLVDIKQKVFETTD